ncbi:hypothetical protein [Rhodanobacter sp. Root627]|uniref:hypothetical protein n=1 Tax=Rhodanobacter sp. Root627 TaxID=1736572 RepID=UPI001F2F2F11|nr:hypothetical protein [Rhodanobacter sp. Root627]
MILLLAAWKGRKARSHGSQSGDFRKVDGDCLNLCRNARANASGVSYPASKAICVTLSPCTWANCFDARCRRAKLDVPMKGDAEEGPELPVKVVLRERRDLAQSFEVQVVIEMALDMVEHLLHPRVVVV